MPGAGREGAVMRVGVIGLGRMGLPIARNLMERGFAVTGYRRSGGADLVAACGTAAASPAEVAGGSDVLLSILPDAGAVDEVVRGPAGTLAAARPGTVHIEMSTVDVGHKARIRDAVRAAGGDMLDCPISGSPGMVAPRLATTFASGEPTSVDAVRPVLDAISGRWVYTGAFGTGASMKYVATMLLAVHTVAAAEALALADRLGLDLELVQQTLDPSIASSAIWKQRGPVMRARRWTPAPGPIETLHAITDQIAIAAAAAGADVPVFAAARTVFDKAMADGWGPLDIAAVHDQLAGRSPGLPGAPAPREGSA
jgi:3-hydroxyisobutyrate dehydrogenase-like beta-hydroxyacid dehydrogenase